MLHGGFKTVVPRLCSLLALIIRPSESSIAFFLWLVFTRPQQDGITRPLSSTTAGEQSTSATTAEDGLEQR